MPTIKTISPCPRSIADAVLNQATPVAGTWYLVKDTTYNIRIKSILAKATWTVQPNPLAVRITIDGQVITHIQANPVSATNYYALLHPGNDEDNQIFDTSATNAALAGTLYEGKSVKIEVRVVGGTTDPLLCRVKMAQW